jgi:hypothetical protein
MMLIADKLIGHLVPIRFALFAFVGGIGLFIHMSTLWFALTVAGTTFNRAQASATVMAMTSNFFVDNLFTYRDRRLRGFRGAARAVLLLCDLRPRRGRECRHRRLFLFQERGLVARRPCRHRRRIGLELCRPAFFIWNQK